MPVAINTCKANILGAMKAICPHYGEEGYSYESYTEEDTGHNGVMVTEFLKGRWNRIISKEPEVVNIFNNLNNILEPIYYPWEEVEEEDN